MNIFRYIKRLFFPEYHSFLLRRGDDIELRIYRNGKPIDMKKYGHKLKGKTIKYAGDDIYEQRSKNVTNTKTKKSKKQK